MYNKLTFKDSKSQNTHYTSGNNERCLYVLRVCDHPQMEKQFTSAHLVTLITSTGNSQIVVPSIGSKYRKYGKTGQRNIALCINESYEYISTLWTRKCNDAT